MTTQLSEKQLKTLVKNSVKEAMDFEFMKLRALLLAAVSPKEQKEIEKLYKKPSRKVAKTYKVEL